MEEPSREKLAEYFAQLQRIEETRSKKAEREIGKLYKSMLKDIRGFLGEEYAKYAEDDALTYTTLAKKGQYARFIEEVQRKVNGINPKINAEITNTVKDMYETAYKGMVNAVSKSSDDSELKKLLGGIHLTQAQVVKAAVNNPIAKLTLPSTLEKSRKQIVYNIKQTVTNGLLNGDRMSTMARKIQGDVEMNYRKAMLITRTEVHRVREEGHDDASNAVDTKLADADSEFRMTKKWRSMRDSSVRHTSMADHRKMDGQVVLQDEEFDLGRGVTAPCPGKSGKAYHDCNCRCYVSHDIMNDEEFFAATGRHFVIESKQDVNENTTQTKEQDDIIKEQSEAAKEMLQELEASDVEYKAVKPLEKPLNTEQIISKLAGGDMTKGSCSSLGFAYIGNRNGLDVTDFRGGRSMDFFSQNSNIKKMLELPNVKGSITMVKQEVKGTIEVLENLAVNKEYYMAAGKHAAIVRKLDSGFEYLELQSKMSNGWTSFGKYGSMAATLNKRFGCKKTANKVYGTSYETSVMLMEVDSFNGNNDFEQIVGYINTATDKQKKGVTGDVK